MHDEKEAWWVIRRLEGWLDVGQRKYSEMVMVKSKWWGWGGLNVKFS